MYYSRDPGSRRRGPAPREESFWERVVPAIGSLRGYTARSFRSDLVAGLTVAAVAVPQAMAYALIAGIPAEHGLYTAVVMTFFGALFASSRQLINGPTNAISIAVLSVLSPLTTPETLVSAAILLAFLVGAIQLAITTLRLGDLTRYISHSVILGFTTGASALLVLDQLKNLLGVSGRGGAHDGFLMRFYETWRHADAPQKETWIVGVGAIASVLLLRAVKKRLNWTLFPELLVVVIAAAICVKLFGLDARGVKVIGEIPARLPSFQMPDLNLALIKDMAGGALTVALLGLLEAISMAKALAAHTRQKLNINQLVVSEAVANLAGSFFQCIPGSGSLTRSAINHQAGAVSQWAGVFSAIAVALTILVLAPAARYVPRAALAGILIVTAFKMVEWRALAFHLRTGRFDAAIVIVTAISAVAISIEFCVLIGVLISFVMAVPRVGGVVLTEFVAAENGFVRERLADDTPSDRVRIFGLEGELFFAAAANLEAQLGRIEDAMTDATRVVVLRLKRARNPDAVGLALIDQFLTDMRERGVTLILCGVRKDLRSVLEHAGFIERLGRDHVFFEEPVRQTSTQKAMDYAIAIAREGGPGHKSP